MWIASVHGFYSIVEKSRGVFHVRARVKADLENLHRAARLMKSVKILTWKGTDYRHRMIVNRLDLAAVMTALMDSIDYPNFKNAIAARPDQHEKVGSYHAIWSEMMKHQR